MSVKRPEIGWQAVSCQYRTSLATKQKKDGRTPSRGKRTSVADQIGGGEPRQQAHGLEVAGDRGGQGGDDGRVDRAQEDADPAREEDQPQLQALDLLDDYGLLLLPLAVTAGPRLAQLGRR